MKWVVGGRLVFSATVAVMLVVFALWLWTRAGVLAGAIAPASAIAAPAQLIDAVYCVAIALAASAQALLLREVVPTFYSTRPSDEVVQVLLCAVAAGGLLSGVVLLVITS